MSHSEKFYTFKMDVKGFHFILCFGKWFWILWSQRDTSVQARRNEFSIGAASQG